jgi:hypothetical protein
VSQPFLIQLQEDKKRPSRKVVHTGAPVFEDVYATKNQSMQSVARLLDALAETQELDMGY